jgi:hypothetical protein
LHAFAQPQYGQGAQKAQGIYFKDIVAHGTGSIRDVSKRPQGCDGLVTLCQVTLALAWLM